MPVPQHVFDPPFNIIRCSHVVLDVVDLEASRAFYETTVGLHVEDRDGRAVYLRGAEEHQHHSLVLRKAPVAACNRLGFKVGNEGDLDKAAAFFSDNGIACAFAEQAFQGRTLQFADPFGFQIELYAAMEKRPHLLRRYDLYKGCHPQRLDHFNVFAAEVQDTVDFFARLGFRLTEYGEEDGRTAASPRPDAPQGQCARLRHHQRPRPTPAPFCLLGADGDEHPAFVRRDGFQRLPAKSRARSRPPRHFQCLLPLCPRSDGHRLELYTSDYFTMDHDHEPLRWSLRDPRRQTLWGAPAPRSWFEQGSPFTGQPVREPQFVADVTIAD